MRITTVLIGLVVFGWLLSGCSTQAKQEMRAHRIESLLTQAGFHQHPADTPERDANLKSMTPLHLYSDTINGRTHFWFPDPDYCHCLYIGNEEAFGRLQQLREEQNQEDQQAVEQTLEDTAVNSGMIYPLWPDPYLY